MQICMNDASIVAFLRGEGPDGEGRYFDDIMNFSDELLEETHDYIQWLFPLREPSAAVPGSPYLENEDAVRSIREDETIQENIVNALIRMERFYRENDHWLRQGDHNHLRITRIIRSVALLGSANDTREFYEFIMRRVDDAMPVTQESLDFWRNSVPASWKSDHDIV